MKKLSKIYKKLGIAFSFPIEIRDAKGNRTYCENSSGYWFKREYNANGNRTYYETSDGYWSRSEYDDKGNETYYEIHYGFWRRSEYDDKGKVTYCEDSNGYKSGTPWSKTCNGRTVEIDGLKYELKLKK